MRFDILTIFPKLIEPYFSDSLFARARAKRLLRIHIHNLRAFAKNRRNKVDDAPFGGGPGMVLQIEPIYRAVRFASSKFQIPDSKKRIILFSTRGKKLNAKTAKRLSKYDQLILICGRYEGVDERVAEHVADEEISIGDYVLSGGELPALVLAETVSRFIPGFLGKSESLEEIKGSYPVYTRPAAFMPKRGARPWNVPRILREGNHAAIKEWRQRYGDGGGLRA
ncbi:MAG: tRNA (guanosine(37)-N1)-methyltransferase TrmD [Candidatus Liptonbacteria bacterium]|nr:tRNA (guanosine(37)-N1)-methyltransferase TrmD [Candidatus Liptonbacteria bacterium]MBI3114355.1 tRNA (guanosine(37)-N1)-methyltransferase TrmD [Candidatus Harrisonbacteria bacterium]